MNRKITGNTAPYGDHHKKIRVCYRCAGQPKYEGVCAFGMETCANCGRMANSTDMHLYMLPRELVVEESIFDKNEDLGIQTAYMVEEKFGEKRICSCINLDDVMRIEYTNEPYDVNVKMVCVVLINDRREFYEITDTAPLIKKALLRPSKRF